MLPPAIETYGSRTLLYSVFRNLVENAIHHGGNWIQLKIEFLGSDDNKLHFALSDTGRGIDSASQLERVFERFYRVDQGRVRNDDNIGSGLGLSIVRHAIEFHGGHIKAENNHPTGLRFEFTLNKVAK